MTDSIRIKGARQNNLKNLDVVIPKQKLVIITGPSGAGKSSLAFDTLYAEGQRRYVESLSQNARQFLTQLEKPDVDAIEGLGPAIAIEQRSGNPNPRSTVGTATEIYDFLRLLYARVGHPFCYKCGKEIQSHTVQQVVDLALSEPEATRLLVCAPLKHDPSLNYGEQLAQFQREGFVRVRVGETVYLLEEGTPPVPGDNESLALVVDRLTLNPDNKQRLTEAVELAMDYAQGHVLLVFPGEDTTREETLCRTPRCTSCGITYPEPQPRNFSFNSPFGACPECHGLGHTMAVSPELVVPDKTKTLAEGAIAPWARKASAAFHQTVEQVAAHYGFSIFTPFGELEDKQQNILLYGSGEEELEFSYEGDDKSHRFSKVFEGVISNLERRFRETESNTVRDEVRRFMVEHTCPLCDGDRLNQDSLHFKINGLSIAKLTGLSLEDAIQWLVDPGLSPLENAIAEKLLQEVRARLGFLCGVGLEYLCLDRPMDSLSSGENQRIRLATQLGSALSGVIYILDEPTIGLHQRDTERLMENLVRLRDAGNTVVVVEHDRETMAYADHLIEIGPEAGEAGGQLVAEGDLQSFQQNPNARTGAYLAGKITIPLPLRRREVGLRKLELIGASGHNLRGLDVVFPLGMITCVTGVSGSGKSTLVLDTLLPALQQKLQRRQTQPLPYESLHGYESLERVAHIDQSAIGKSSRSNPGTYLGVFTLVREQFSATPESRSRGYHPRRFSFNVDGGRCAACQGEGVKRIEMHFLPDVFVRCDTCDGTRYNRETLEIRYRGKTISDVLEMTVQEVEQFFRAIPAIRSRLQPMLDVGLGYLRLGQPANTLSGGEAQRLKIARELNRRERGGTLYLMDEPTTGLHFEEVERLVEVLNQLVEHGNSAIVIEHNLELIKCADFMIEIGPDAGINGGLLVAQGTPEEVVIQAPNAFTARYLAPYLNKNQPLGTPSKGPIGKNKTSVEKVLHN